MALGKNFRTNKKDFIQLYGLIFEKIQTEKIFPDSKTFVDSLPKRKPQDILYDFDTQHLQTEFHLFQFVYENFRLPDGQFPEETEEIHEDSMTKYITLLWPHLLRKPDQSIPDSTLIPLPYEYIVPGGRFREIYYWDSFFTLLGLVADGQQEIAINMIKNFKYLIDTVGHIPNGNRVYYLTRSQPPFYALMVDHLVQAGLIDVSEYINSVEKEYLFWMKNEEQLQDGQTEARVVKLSKDCIANRYYDADDTPREEGYFQDYTATQSLAPELRSTFYRNIRAAAESGWDFSSRWFKDYKNFASICTTDIVPVDLNCLLYFIEQKLSQWYNTKDNEKAKIYAKKAAARKAMILQYCWSEQDTFFFDYSFSEERRTKVWSLAGVFPLYVGIASQIQADAVAQHLQKHFLKEGGLTTTLHYTGQQWDAPNGWAPLQYIAAEGLRRYGHIELAKEIEQRWLKTCELNFKKTGGMYEKYDVEKPLARAEGGEYPVQKGFGWTNGVVAIFLRQIKLPKK
ncbi:alpha,alpha-trehalase TreF [soil metagenome]